MAPRRARRESKESFISYWRFSRHMAQRTVTRYGTRYGRTIRERLAKVEQQYKGKQKCPHCSYTAVKRLAAGIWHCTKCNTKSASRAYQLRTPPAVKNKTEELDV